ncbi:hypothetical protein [Methanobrevibacter sp.]|uniref:hypothetical protein n=1 Tax=Methanobrevibacter sp. TaxID=66852 RepID=UPI003863228A
MKFKYVIAVLLLFALVGFVCAEAYIPTEGNFAFREVENYTLHGINFTVPTDYDLKDSGDDFLLFKDGKDKLKITVEKNGTIKKVNSTNKTKAGKTMVGSVKGYLVDKNSTSYTFSYKEGEYLVVIKSNDLSLIMGIMGKD